MPSTGLEPSIFQSGAQHEALQVLSNFLDIGTVTSVGKARPVRPVVFQSSRDYKAFELMRQPRTPVAVYRIQSLCTATCSSSAG